MIVFLLWLSLSAVVVSADRVPSFNEATVYISAEGAPTVRHDVKDLRGGAAYGYFNNSLLATGWGVLEVKTGPVPDRMAMFAAGYAEGILTAPLIAANVANMRRFWASSVSKETWAKIFKFINAQEVWIRQYAAASDNQISRAAARITDQVDGLLAGVQTILGSSNITRQDILMLQYAGDLMDLNDAFDSINFGTEQLYRRLDAMTPRQRRQYVALKGMCSAMVVLTPGLEDILMAHVTWFTYSATMRIYKHYNFALRDNPWPVASMSFSSYAGIVASIDDFYVLGNNMVMLQTTNSIYNSSLYAFVRPSSLPAWYRVRMANHLGRSGEEWARVIATANSGTYNNQYMIIDLKRVHLKDRVDKGALTIVEQIPGLVEWSDQTAILADGHWPSYNVPFHARIYNLSGYPEFVARYGVDFSYQMAARAKLFRRDANSVRSIANLKQLIRSNRYKTDPYSNDDPTAAFCARGDLVTPKGEAMGCYDGKVTDYRMAMNMEANAISGPTTNDGSLPQFSWARPPFTKLPHWGLPNVYNFQWQRMKPQL